MSAYSGAFDLSLSRMKQLQMEGSKSSSVTRFALFISVMFEKRPEKGRINN